MILISPGRIRPISFTLTIHTSYMERRTNSILLSISELLSTVPEIPINISVLTTPKFLPYESDTSSTAPSISEISQVSPYIDRDFTFNPFCDNPKTLALRIRYCLHRHQHLGDLPSQPLGIAGSYVMSPSHQLDSFRPTGLLLAPSLLASERSVQPIAKESVIADDDQVASYVEYINTPSSPAAVANFTIEEPIYLEVFSYRRSTTIDGDHPRSANEERPVVLTLPLLLYSALPLLLY